MQNECILHSTTRDCQCRKLCLTHPSFVYSTYTQLNKYKYTFYLHSAHTATAYAACAKKMQYTFVSAPVPILETNEVQENLIIKPLILKKY